MPLPIFPNAISLQAIQTEFGGTNPISISEYYRNGGLVHINSPGNIPLSGVIAFSDFHGSSQFVPLTVTVTPTTQPEGSSFSVNVTDPAAINRSVIYWALTNFSANISAADFSGSTTGSITYNGGTGSYQTVTITPIADSIFDSGTFTFKVYADAARTQEIGTSGTLTITDFYSTGSVSLNRTQIYRYANLDTALMSATATLTSSGLEGATIYWEAVSASSLTSDDLTALNGTLTVPTGGNIVATITATSWSGQTTITSDKSVQIRFRLNNSSGTILGTSSAITLTRHPEISASFFLNQTTVREGESVIFVINANYIPAQKASVFRTLNINGTDTGSSSDLYDFGFIQETSLPVLANEVIYGALDTASESNETVTISLRINNSAGPEVARAPVLTIQSPAIIQASQITTTRANTQLTNISAYPISRTFTAQYRNQSATAWQTPSGGSSLTVAANATTSNSVVNLAAASVGTAANHSLEYQVTNANYQTYTSTSTESFIWPVTCSVSMSGTNAQGVFRSITATVGGIPYATSRIFTIEYRLRAPPGDWDPWAYISTVTVPANSTSASAVIFERNTLAVADLQIRCVLTGFETKESNQLIQQWI